MIQDAQKFTARIVFAGALMGAGAWLHAQGMRVDSVPPTVISGSDVGFRIEGTKSGTPTGTIVVRINGRWIEAEIYEGRPKLLGK
jgi:hypothetical protein